MKYSNLRAESLKIFDVIRSPVITEKSTVATEHNQYTFKVANVSNKQDIKLAVEKLYNVKVESVNTLTLKGKVKRFKGRLGKRNDVKKAIVRIAKGQTIDMSSGL